MENREMLRLMVAELVLSAARMSRRMLSFRELTRLNSTPLANTIESWAL